MNLSINHTNLVICLDWVERLLAVHLGETITIPLSQILSVSADLPPTTWREVRAPGSFVPGLIKAGTYYTDEGRAFWYVTPKHQYLNLQLSTDEYYKRIVVNVENAAEWVDRLQRAIAPRQD
jgi:hypothetical protein